MSSNLIFNKIDINHRSKNEIINSYILDDIKKNINNKKYQDKIKNDINHQSKVSIDFQDGKNKNIINLENVYKNAIVSLENLKKETEKNIFFTKKYSENINNHFIQNHLTNNNLFSQNVLMKKKISDQSSSYFLYKTIEFFKKKFSELKIEKVAKKFFEKTKNKIINTYEVIKKEAIDLFDGTTIKKMFSSLQGNETVSEKDGESTVPLAKYVEQLQRTIESSKNFIQAIIEKIRYQGKIKVINELNNNPQHPEFQSSFPDLFIMIPTLNNEDDFYPFKRIDENFDLQGRKDILKKDKNFKLRMDKSIQKSYYKDFFNYDDSWQVSDQLDSSQNIASTIEHFQKAYEILKCSADLDKHFMKDCHSSLFIINDKLITAKNRDEMIENFKKILPNINSQKLISIYANQKFLHQSYLQLISEYPEIEEYQTRNSRNVYKISNLSDGSIKIVATNLSDLDVKNTNYIKKYRSFGVRATIVVPLNDLPIIKYSHFFK